MSAFEFQPVDKTVRPPELIRRRQRDAYAKIMRQAKIRTKSDHELALERDRDEFLELRGVRCSQIAKRGSAPISVKLIILAVAQHYGLPAVAIKGPSRLMLVIRARHMAFYLARKLTGKSFPDIGHLMGRDHTTVLHGFRRVDEMVSAGDQEIIQAIAAIEEAIEP